jgi:hypothetical protein
MVLHLIAQPAPGSPADCEPAGLQRTASPEKIGNDCQDVAVVRRADCVQDGNSRNAGTRSGKIA